MDSFNLYEIVEILAIENMKLGSTLKLSTGC